MEAVDAVPEERFIFEVNNIHIEINETKQDTGLSILKKFWMKLPYQLTLAVIRMLESLRWKHVTNKSNSKLVLQN